MAQITLRRCGELVRGVFALLMDHPDGRAAREVLQALETRVSPTPFEASSNPNSPDIGSPLQQGAAQVLQDRFRPA
jgi:restriction system protein